MTKRNVPQLSSDHNVFIFGAGFSAKAGMPLMSNFIAKMYECHDWLVREERSSEAAAVRAVLEFRETAKKATYWIPLDLENIEELFCLASAYPTSMGRRTRVAIAATLDYVRRTTEVQPVHIEITDKKGHSLMDSWVRPYPPPCTPGHYLVDPYRMWLARILGLLENGKPVGRNTFITFNYDTILEETLEALGVPFSYRFEKSEALFEANAQGNSRETGVTVLKIHGSINWTRTKDRTRTVVFPSYKELRLANRSPQLIPPSWKKSYQRQFSIVMGKAVAHLETARRVIVVGFSMPATDVHFKYMLAAGFANNNALKKVLFITPTADELKQRVQTHFKEKDIKNDRVEFRSNYFETVVMGMSTGWAFLKEIDRPHPIDIRYSISP